MSLISKEDISIHWPLTNVTDFTLLQNFDLRETSAFTAREGQFVFKVLDQGISLNDADKRTFIFNFLESHSFKNAPRLLKTKNNQSFAKIRDRFVIVLEKVEGQIAAPTPESFAQLGAVMAKLNSITNYPQRSEITIGAILPTFADLALQLPSDIQKPYLDVALDLPLLHDLPRSLIHFEMNLHANAIQKDDGTLVIL